MVSVPAGAKALPSDVTLLSADDRGVVLTYAVPQTEITPIETPNGKFQRIYLPNCPNSTFPGEPELPARIILLGVPPEAEITAEVVTFDFDERAGIDVCPVPGVSGGDQKLGTPIAKYQKSQSAYALAGFFPSGVVAVEGPFFLRHQRAVRVKLFPVQYNPQTRTLRVARQITVRVNFSRGGTTPSQAALPSGDSYEPIYRAGLLNYEQARGWRVTPPPQSLAQAAQVDSFSRSPDWYKITVRDNAIYKIDAPLLAAAGVNLATLDPRTIRIFSGDGRALSPFNVDPRPQFQELAILVTGDVDGRFDPSDLILFYGWSVDRWTKTAAGQDTFVRHPYTRENVFWFTFGGSFPTPPKRMATRDGSLRFAAPSVPTDFTELAHFEDDRIFGQTSGGDVVDYFTWYWLNNQKPPPLFFNLPGVAAAAPETVAITHTNTGMNLTVNGVLTTALGPGNGISRFVTSSLVDGLNQFALEFFTNPFDPRYYLNAIEMAYPRRFQAVSDFLPFGFTGTGAHRFDVSGITSTAALLLDVTNGFDQVQMINVPPPQGGVFRFADSLSGTEIRYAVAGSAAWRRPLRLAREVPSNLRDPASRADLLVITHDDFVAEANQYAAYRQAQSGLTTKVVKVSDIYDQFAWGLFDPVAIRDFLKYTFENWTQPAPSFVLLVGDGSYDYRNNLGTGAKNYIPPFIAAPAFDASTVADENYLYFGQPGILDPPPFDQVLAMVIGRWPVRTPEEVQTVIAKVKAYEATPELGEWRNQITLVADDEFGEPPFGVAEAFHTQQTEGLARHVPPLFSLNKIYLFEFPFDANRKKPTAEEAIISTWNRGTLIIDYIGHGNPDVWAHESVFKRGQDIPRLTNFTRLPLVYNASCSIGFFDSPFSEGMGEELVRSPLGGAIAVIAATRLAFAFQNVALNEQVFDFLLGQDSLSIGQALYLAKLLRQYQLCFPSPPCPQPNDRQYVLFCDPALHLGAPKNRVRFLPPVPDSLAALTVAQIIGEATDTSGAPLPGFSGSADVVVFDAERPRAYIMAALPNSPVTYTLPGNRIYRGKAQVNGGQFNLSFVVPKDISYGSKTAKISVYIAGGSTDGVGLLDSLTLAGAPVAITDSLGPEIDLRFDGRPAADGDFVRADATLTGMLRDQNGINITGEPGHGIVLTLDGNRQASYDLTDRFAYDPGSFQAGTVTFTLPNLASGAHTVELKAWDSANNSAVRRVTIQAASEGSLAIRDFLAYPNPFRDQTTFCYQLTRDVDQMKIMIFTESGRQIKTIEGPNQLAGYHADLVWDGCDQRGDRVANGLYLCKAVAQGRVAAGTNAVTKTAEEFGKVLVVR